MDSFVYFVAAMFFGFIGLEIWLIRNWSGLWKFIVALPLIALFAVAGKIIFDVRENPTSHNLWPFEIIILCGYGLGAVLLIAILKAVFTASNRNKEGPING